MEKNKVWFVTGASKGIGLSLVKKLLEKGYLVAASSRKKAALTEAVEDSSANFLPLELDLTNDQEVKTAVQHIISHFGKIDVVVNNAGYGQLGTLEELSPAEVEENFTVNVFAALNVIRQVMPQLRAQQSGQIFNIASVGGYFGAFAGWGVYCATKFAMAGFTEALAEEVREFGIGVSVVYPGYFRTDFLTQGSIRTPENPIADYTAARASEQQHIEQINGNQPNDPNKAADALIAVSETGKQPVHLLLGVDAIAILKTKIDIITKDAEQWKTYTESTGF